MANAGAALDVGDDMPSARDPEDGAANDAYVTHLSARLQRLERWLLAELRHGRTERDLLEELVNIKEEDLELHRKRLDAAQKQVMRLRFELCESRTELLERRRLLGQAIVDNARLRADNTYHKRHPNLYRCIRANDMLIKYKDTEF